MSPSVERQLQSIIENFEEEGLLSFAQGKIKGLTKTQKNPKMLTAQHSTDDFSSVNLLGTAKFDDIDKLLVIAIQSSKPLTTRSGKKSQYELAKKILKAEDADAAIFAFYDADGNFRFSFIQANYIGTSRHFTDFRRYTYFVDKNQSNRTFKERIGNNNKWRSLDNILEAFSVEPLNKAFYKDIQTHFDNLKSDNFLTMRADKAKRPEFSVRLIGRLLFCWFLKNLQSDNKQPLIPENLLSLDKAQTDDYYRKVIEPLFFDVLNTPIDKRTTTLENHASIPYLNGGLFEKQPSDNDSDSDVKNDWFNGFFETLSRYNFTVDENSANDTEVSIDPEMLGTIFENLLAEQNPETQAMTKKATGSFYTPRIIVDYMAEQSLTAYLQQKTKVDNAKILALFKESINKDEQTTSKEAEQLLTALFELKILDPACGSGAFPMGVMQKMLAMLQHLDRDGSWWKKAQRRTINSQSGEAQALKTRIENANAEYAHKLGIVSRCLYGADIQPIAAEITKLRCFLSLIIDEKIDDNADNRGIVPLPNLEFKFVTANSLISLPTIDRSDQVLQGFIDLFSDLSSQYLFSYGQTKTNAKKNFEQKYNKYFHTKQLYQSDETLLDQLRHWKPFANTPPCPWFDAQLMFGVDKFDVVIGNPPYVSTKGVKSSEKKTLEAQYGFADDLYSHFYFRGMALLRSQGILSYITSKTFWTIQTKRNVRDLLLSKKIDYIFDSANPFESAMVDTGIIGVCNEPTPDNHHITFLDGREDLAEPHRYSIEQSAYQQAQNAVIFEPSAHNLAIYEKYNNKVKQLHKQWWGKIKTSRDIAKNQQELQNYRDNLKAGDMTLLGCLTEGGVGLQTGNNGKYVAVKDNSKPAQNIRASRPKKLLEAIKKNAITEFQHLDNIGKVKDYLSKLSESEITQLFDHLKDEYGRDIFGQGYLFRIISDADIADVDALSDDEKQNGISPDKPFYVPYDKGDKDGNRWYLETPFAIAWSQENVAFLKSDPRARYQGYDFYFREGFCWSDINTTYLKCRLKSKSVNDVKSMSFYQTTSTVPDYFIISMINSTFISLFVDNFINSTQTFQINDARQLPIIIPNKAQLAEFEQLFERAVAIQKRKFAQTLAIDEAETQLDEIQTQLDCAVNKLYGIE